MSGSRPPYLQRRGDTYHLRVRVPADLQERVGLRELRRALLTDSLSEARPLALLYGARVLEIFLVTKKRQLSKDEVRALIGAAFADLRPAAERGFRPSSDFPEIEVAEQRDLALLRVPE